MRLILVLGFMFFISESMAACLSPVSRSNYSPNTVLTSAALNLDFNTIYTRVNELPGDCITNETITSAKIDNGTIVNADISDTAEIARSKLGSVNYAISASGSGLYVNSTTSFTDVTNLSVTITTTGAPVEIYLINEDGTNISSVGTSSGSSTTVAGLFALYRGATKVGEVRLQNDSPSGAIQITLPPGVVRFTDTPVAGTYTYKLQAASGWPSTSVLVSYAKLIAREL